MEEVYWRIPVQFHVYQVDSPPRKINPNSPKEICVKLTLSWSGIGGES